MQCTKDQGAEVWGGMGFAVNGHIKLNGNNVLRLKSYAPEVGKVVKVKLETSAGNVAGLHTIRYGYNCGKSMGNTNI